MEALAILLATSANKALTQSALPDAPVEPPEPPRRNRTGPLRRATAVALHRLADMVEPHAAGAGQPATR